MKTNQLKNTRVCRIALFKPKKRNFFQLKSQKYGNKKEMKKKMRNGEKIKKRNEKEIGVLFRKIFVEKNMFGK